jgi:hypothetical protein
MLEKSSVQVAEVGSASKIRHGWPPFRMFKYSSVLARTTHVEGIQKRLGSQTLLSITRAANPASAARLPTTDAKSR